MQHYLEEIYFHLRLLKNFYSLLMSRSFYNLGCSPNRDLFLLGGRTLCDIRSHLVYSHGPESHPLEPREDHWGHPISKLLTLPPRVWKSPLSWNMGTFSIHDLATRPCQPSPANKWIVNNTMKACPDIEINSCYTCTKLFYLEKTKSYQCPLASFWWRFLNIQKD